MTENQTPDAFEAALAANADEIVAEVATPEIVEEVVLTEATSNQMRTIQMQNSVAPFAQRSATGT